MERDVRTWTDLFFTSEGVIKMSMVGGVVFLLFVLFGPAPVDERKLELDRQWAQHHARGGFFQNRKDTGNKKKRI